jgi:DNA recombination protein RmuC
MQNIELIVIVGLIVGILVYILSGKDKDVIIKSEDVGLNLILNQLNELARTVDSKFGESQKEVSENLKFHSSESNKIIRDMTERLTRLDETNKQVISFADQLQSLENILKNPKQRGILGEYYLETLLRNVMPPGSFEVQYKLGKTDDGDELIPDAVVFVKEKIIPIDSKFSLENYNRIVEERDPLERERLEKLFENDLKNRILETSKYIRPELGTMDFAFMFIPHEAIYYDLLIGRVGKGEDENLIQRAANKYKVIIVSPTSFLAYLQTVLQGLNALKIEKDAVEIRKRVGELGTHLKAYEEYHNKLGNSLATVVNHYTSSSKELRKVDKDVMRISGSSPQIELIEVEKPHLEE